MAEEASDESTAKEDGDDDKPPDKTDERWKPPTDWTDARRVRDWLQLGNQSNATVAGMLEYAALLLREGTKAVQEAMPSSPDEPTVPPDAEPKAADKTLIEHLLDGRVGVNRWKPNWADSRDVRNWLTIHARSFENMASMMEDFGTMLRAMGQTMREARPPWPIVAEDTRSEEAEPKK